jgi:hypothetical protein
VLRGILRRAEHLKDGRKPAPNTVSLQVCMEAIRERLILCRIAASHAAVE